MRVYMVFRNCLFTLDSFTWNWFCMPLGWFHAIVSGCTARSQPCCCRSDGERFTQSAPACHSCCCQEGWCPSRSSPSTTGLCESECYKLSFIVIVAPIGVPIVVLQYMSACLMHTTLVSYTRTGKHRQCKFIGSFSVWHVQWALRSFFRSLKSSQRQTHTTWLFVQEHFYDA